MIFLSIRYKIDTFGRNAVVVGRSKNVGMPIAMMLHSDGKHDSALGMDATVTVCHRYTPAEQLEFFCRNADIIITATGMCYLLINLCSYDCFAKGVSSINCFKNTVKNMFVFKFLGCRHLLLDCL